MRGQETELPPIAVMEDPTGALRVNFSYLGNPPSQSGASYEVWVAVSDDGGQIRGYEAIWPGRDSFTLPGLATGDYTVQLLDGRFEPFGPSEPATVGAGQTADAYIDLSAHFGQVTGTLLLNGQPGGSVSLQTYDSNGVLQGSIGVASTAGPPPGAFSALLPAGDGVGAAYPGGIPIPAFLVSPGQNTALDPIAITEDPKGDVRIDFTYLGFPPTDTGADYEIWLSISDSSGQVRSYDTVHRGRDDVLFRQLTVGDYLVELLDWNFQPMGPATPVTVAAEQTAQATIEISDFFGQVVGTLLVNGQPGGGVSLQTRSPTGTLLGAVGASSTAGPPLGAFAALLPAGNGTGTAYPGSFPIPSFTVVAGQIANLGGVLGNTQAGSDVLVQPIAVDENGDPLGISPINFVYQEVTLPGETTVTVTQGGPAPAEGYKLGKPATYFVLETDAEFAGSVEVCIDYSNVQFGNESKLQLQHYTDTDGDGIADDWVDITLSLDPANDFICGVTNSFSYFAIVEPDNQPPVLTINNSSVVVSEGDLAGNSGTFEDPDGDPLLLTVSRGSLQQTAPGAWTWSEQTSDDLPSTQVVVTADDGNGGVAMQTFELRADNVAPAPSIQSLDGAVDEGGTVALVATFLDPGVGDTHTVSIDWDDGSPAEVFAVAAGVRGFSVSHTYADDQPAGAAVTVAVVDDDGGSGSTGASVAVDNVAPVIDDVSPTPAPVPVGTTVALNASFSDVGLQDTHECFVDWDDPASPGAVDGALVQLSGAGTCDSARLLDQPGVYSVVFTIRDDDGGEVSSEPTLAVVYDPSAGFVTGGGWIESPAGAYAADPTLTGKANFGFVARYKKGQSTPGGQTEFQFKAGDLNFRSTAYQWLVVAGSKAQFKGEGTVNGSAGYGFLLTAQDGDASPSGQAQDRFRIKIWDKNNGDAVVYDNVEGASDDIDVAPQQLGGGSIVIHAK